MPALNMINTPQLLLCLLGAAVSVASTPSCSSSPTPTSPQVDKGDHVAGGEDPGAALPVFGVKERHPPAAPHHNTVTSRAKRQAQPVLPAPYNLKATSSGRDYIDLEWEYSGDRGGVEFLVKVLYNSGGNLAKDQVVRGTSARVGDLAPSTEYRLSVSAFKPLPRGLRATSADSNAIVSSTQELILPAPTNLRVTGSSLDFIDLEWQHAGAQDGVEFLITVHYSGGVLAKDQVVRGTSARVHGLAPHTTYDLSVKAFKALPQGLRATSGDSATVTARTEETSRPPPTPRPPPPTPRPPPPTPRPPPPTPSLPSDGTSTGTGAVCTLEQATKKVNVTVNVLSCGSRPVLDIRDLLRSDRVTQCGSSGGVPVGTVVMAECWGVATYLSQCHADGTWHPYGSHQQQAPSSRHLCQFPGLNSPVCGRRPPYQRLPPFILTPRPQWSWLVGVFRMEKYACTATIITPHFLLTAAHCLTRAQEISQDPVDVRTIRVQHLDSEGIVVRHFVKSIHVFPGFKAGARPSQDLALIRLEVPITFSYHVHPACIHTERFPTDSIAATFRRSGSTYAWELILQEFDFLCLAPQHTCLSTLSLDDNQFCATDLEQERHHGMGSSGGPYLVNAGQASKEQWAVVGLVSSSYSTDSCPSPRTIYTFVKEFWPWISRCVHEENCS